VWEGQGEVVGGVAQAVGVEEGVEGEGAEAVGCLCGGREGLGVRGWMGGGGVRTLEQARSSGISR